MIDVLKDPVPMNERKDRNSMDSDDSNSIQVYKIHVLFYMAGILQFYIIKLCMGLHFIANPSRICIFN